MEKAAIPRHVLVLVAVALTVLPKLADSQTRTMCITQLSLANQACSILPVWRVPIDPRDTPVYELHESGGEVSAGHGTVQGNYVQDHDGDRGRGHGKANGHGHRRKGHDDGDYDGGDEERGHSRRGRGHSHGQRHRRHRRHQVHHSLVREECCRWLKELDSPCVCEVLMRRLPRFLTKPHHNYSVTVENTCELTYRCDEF